MGFKDSKLFRNACSKAYKGLDINSSGRVDYKEVIIGLLKLYDQLNARLPDHVPAPKRSDMMAMCEKFDVDGDGFIDEDEFYELAKVLFGTRTAFKDSLPWIIGSALTLKLVVFPWAAGVVVDAVKEGHGVNLPIAPVAAVIGIAWKWFAKRTDY